MSIIDISIPLQNGLVVWPGDVPIQIERRRRLEQDGANVSVLHQSLHSGTHIDPALHFISDGRTVDQLPLDVLIGPANVADLTGVEGHITAADLERQGLPADCRRLLLRTRNSQLWERDSTTFHEDYVALAPDGAQWIVDRGIQLVGIDYLSVEPYHKTGRQVHLTLLGANVVLLETINLAAVAPGRYQLVCLPLLIKAGDGAPARAVLITP